jgi:hypothetical protein
MFKIIRDFVQVPQFLAMCDEACGQYVALPFEASEEQAQQGLFVLGLERTGWKVGLDRQLCPLHVARLAETTSQRRLIELPTISLHKV